jgi:hypothetical protein
MSDRSLYIKTLKTHQMGEQLSEKTMTTWLNNKFLTIEYKLRTKKKNANR